MRISVTGFDYKLFLSPRQTMYNNIFGIWHTRTDNNIISLHLEACF